MVQSAHSFWPPRPLRMSPVNTLQHIGKLRRCDDDDTVCRRRPDELAALQSLGVERHAETVVPKNLDEIATAAAKGEKIAGVRIALQRLLHLQGKCRGACRYGRSRSIHAYPREWESSPRQRLHHRRYQAGIGGTENTQPNAAPKLQLDERRGCR
jgi:hypothetical protein